MAMLPQLDNMWEKIKVFLAGKLYKGSSDPHVFVYNPLS